MPAEAAFFPLEIPLQQRPLHATCGQNQAVLTFYQTVFVSSIRPGWPDSPVELQRVREVFDFVDFGKLGFE